MENILKTIITKKKEFIKEAKKQVTLNQLRFLAEDQDKTPLFLKSMQQPGINIIAEIKRASPSKGLIRPDLDPAELSKEYEQGGAAAISVLTERAFFQGSCADLCAVRQAVTLPVLRKDFIISAYQIYEAVVHGADAVLLIVRILEKSQLHDYLALCRELNLDALVEAHTEAEIEIAMAQGVTLIGINNRNLDSFETNISTAMRLVQLLEPRHTAVAESGINTHDDIKQLLAAGIHNFLIGESLVRSQDPGAKLKSLAGVQNQSS